MLPTTIDRVPSQTCQQINEQIHRATEARLAKFGGASAADIDARIKELDDEWDIERTLEANAASVCLAGALLGMTIDRRFFALPLVVGAFLLEHALQGWCPPLEIFRRLGVRTSYEIDYERYALKALRGDFGTREEALSPSQALAAAMK